MKPAVVFPINDLSGETFSHLEDIRADLAEVFECAYVCITPSVRTAQSRQVNALEADPLFEVTELPDGLQVGTLFARLYRYAAGAAPDDQVLHLCFPDRLAFSLKTAHRPAFMEHIRRLDAAAVPIIFQRSEQAWATHPANYREIEGMVTRAGELLLGDALDYAWCHIALTARDLRTALERVTRTDLAMMAELVLAHRGRFRTIDVDWLAWEDPFIFGADAEKLKLDRENSAAEMEKRYAYAIPMLQVLQAEARNGHR